MADSPTVSSSSSSSSSYSSSSSSSSSSFGTRRFMGVGYFFTIFFVACTIVFVFNSPSNYQSSIRFTNILKTRSHFTIFSHFFPNSTTTTTTTYSSSFRPPDSLRRSQQVFTLPFSRERDGFHEKETNSSLKRSNKSNGHQVRRGSLNGPKKGDSEDSNVTFSIEKGGVSGKTNSSLKRRNRSYGNQVRGGKGGDSEKPNSNVTFSREESGVSGKTNSSSSGGNYQPPSSADKTEISENQVLGCTIEVDSERSLTNQTSSSDSVKSAVDKNATANCSSSGSVKNGSTKMENWFDLSSDCEILEGSWVKDDDSYPLYAAGSCPHIDEPFDCFRNGRPDNGYEKFRWQPKGCNIPRLNGRDLLELLRGKRLVYVGDSLNRNMWESMVCVLRNSVKDKSKVFEASGRQDLRTQNSYSFLFTDYNCSVEFFRSTFLVQEWEMPDTNGSKKETLRLDLIERSSDRYRSADILVFNTGHWWTHEKTSQGKGYYQEGSHVYSELDAVEAFRKAMTTWARWIDASINPTKTLVFFRGYSASHFSGGQWNSGGQCDKETEPITNEAYLSAYLPIMSMLEMVLKGMKTPVFYLNVTKMTDFRKDAHPSIYRKQNLTEDERRSPWRFQDCSHWCLPGVPDTWNELVYAQVVKAHNQKQLQQQKQTAEKAEKALGLKN